MEKAAKDLDFMQAAKLRDDIKKLRTVDLITLFSKIFNNKFRNNYIGRIFHFFINTRLVASGFRPILIAVCLMALLLFMQNTITMH
jgi:hypothetical protein